MFEQILRGALVFAVLTYAIGTIKTLMMASWSGGQHGAELVMVNNTGGKPVMAPVIAGTDIAMPFDRELPTASRVVGTARLYYAVHGHTAIRDSRYGTLWR